MKKSLLVNAISAAMLSTGAYAFPTTVELELWTVLPGQDAAVTCPGGAPVSTGLTVVGLGSPLVAFMIGGLCLDPSFGSWSPLVALDFALTGVKVGTVGTVFDAGTVDIWTNWGTSSGWIAYGTISAASTPIPCLISGGVGGITWPLPPPPPIPAPACAANLLGYPAKIYMQ